MILLSGPLKYDRQSILFLRIEMVTTKIVYLKSLKKTCHQLLSMMNVLDIFFYFSIIRVYSNLLKKYVLLKSLIVDLLNN